MHRKISERNKDFKSKATNSYAFEIIRDAQVFFKKVSVPIEGGIVSDQQEYVFNFRKDVGTRKIDQRCIIIYNEQNYFVQNVDSFNEGLISVTAVKKQ